MRQHQSRQRQEHLLGPNWSLQQLMASCGCVFTSHLFCMHCFPASETRVAHFNALFPQLSVSFCLSSSFLLHKRCCFAASTWFSGLLESLHSVATQDFPLSSNINMENKDSIIARIISKTLNRTQGFNLQVETAL